MLTSVYVDGFNLYYGALKRTRFKWLDLRRMVEQVFPNDEIGEVHYFTATVEARRGDEGAPQRQQTYWRALRTLEGLFIHEGTFRPRTIRRPLASSLEGALEFVDVRHVEEKKSDVNLATRLVADAGQQKYQQAVILSNDSDFDQALKCVRDEFGLRVVLLNPDIDGRTQRDIARSATSVKRLWKRHVRDSQFPSQMQDTQGEFHRPAAW